MLIINSTAPVMLIVLIVFVILSLVVIVNNNVISLNYKGMTGSTIHAKETKKKNGHYTSSV